MAGSDDDTLEQLNEEFQALLVQFEGLSPTIHGWVVAKGTINYLYAVIMPNLLHSVVNQVETEILAEGIGVSRRVSSQVDSYNQTMNVSAIRHYDTGHRRTFTLAGVALASRIRMRIILKVYTPIIHDVVRSALLMSAGSLLQDYKNSVGLAGIITGASLSFHVFNQPNSLIEVSGVNWDYSERTEVLLVGSSALDAVEGILKASIEGVKDLRDLVNYFKRVLDAIKGIGQAIDTARQPPDSVLSAPGYLVYESGFDPVIKCESIVCLPQPVIVIVRNLDEGTWKHGIFNFLPPRPF